MTATATTLTVGPEGRGGSVCRSCGDPIEATMCDLGVSPLCERILHAHELDDGEMFFPLHVRVCSSCWLVQIPEFVPPEEIFHDYAYFSSYSRAWLDHARRYVDDMVDRWSLGPGSSVVELASNDGYLLQYFAEHDVPVLGIEPAANVAEVAIEQGIETLVEFFGQQMGARLARERGPADLIAANNVLAQVPDLNSFVAGIGELLAAEGVATIEFPHVLELLRHNQFDTIYHEHYSYFSLVACDRLFGRHGMEVFDVEQLWTHGGSLRLYVGHRDAHDTTTAVADLRAAEREAGLETLESYTDFQDQVEATKHALLTFLIDARERGRRVVGYGAPGKGNTLLNFCGIRTDLVEFTVDRNPHKHGMFLPGSRIPIRPVEELWAAEPDDVLILPWNLRDEIAEQLAGIREWGGRFVVPIPTVEHW